LAKLSKNRVFAYIMWNSTCPINVSTIVNSINNIKLILNYTITCPLIILLNGMPLIYYKA
jgi:hypothetical protein